ncbi:MAG: FxLYD domain-containing protein [Chloroflexi bacterium]|nr:FxLYD domain-containing protein [Chloroflexota bacterium]
MNGKKLTKKTLLIGPLLAALIGGGTLVGCGPISGVLDGQGSGSATVSQEASEGSGGESGGEHSGGEGTEGQGGEGAGGGEEATANQLAADETFDMVRNGARLILSYDAGSNAFTGTVENTTNNVLRQVRIEVHLSNGAELGPTTPIDLAPGGKVDVNLPSTAAAFTTWVAHAEVGSGGEGSQSGGEGSGGESGPDGPEGKESGNEAAMEAAMSSPVTPLDQTWEGVLGGLAVSARYDAATRTIHYTVQNTLQEVLCYVQSEPHLKSGTQTVGELGPDMLGHLSPGQQATSSIAVSSEPQLAGVAFDGYVIHMEVFDCGGTGPAPHTGGEGAEGSGGEGSGGEGHGSGGEGSGSEGSEGSGGGEEATANQLAPDETFDMVRSGARLILSYDAGSNAFKGTVENTTNNILRQVRIEVHLSNGAELGPTTPVDLAPGEKLDVNLPSTAAAFTGWVAHAEVGSGGGESSGEHGGSGGGGESGGEHGSGGEQSGGG